MANNISKELTTLRAEVTLNREEQKSTTEAVDELAELIRDALGIIGPVPGKSAAQNALGILEAAAPEASDNPESAAYAYLEAMNWLQTVVQRTVSEDKSADPQPAAVEPVKDEPKGKGK